MPAVVLRLGARSVGKRRMTPTSGFQKSNGDSRIERRNLMAPPGAAAATGLVRSASRENEASYSATSGDELVGASSYSIGSGLSPLCAMSELAPAS